MKRVISVFLAILVMCSLLSGCKNEFSLVCHIGDYPLSLDPQMASTQIETIITGNAFEGLMKFDEMGIPVPAAAESYTVSSDKLTYTFTLRDGLKWSNGETLTASDFVFGFERATDKSTKAPYGYLLNSIEGAEERLSGGNNHLSISASGNKLTVTLKEKNDAFLSVLCHPVASPCKSDFFTGCNGKYGIGAKNIISNGIYKIAYTASDSLIRISKNAYYHNSFETDCTAVEFNFNDIKKDENFTDKLLKNSWDLAFSDFESAQKAKDAGMNTIDSYNSQYFILFNPNSNACKNINLRKAYALSAGDINTDSFLKSNKLLPDDVTLCGTVSREISEMNSIKFDYSPDTARNLFLKASSNVSGINGVSVYCDDNEKIQNIIKPIVASWQKNLGAFFNISAVSKNHINNNLLNQNYSVMFAEIDSGDHSSAFFIKNIYTALGSPNELKAAYESCQNAKTLSEAVSAVNQFTNALYAGCYAIPVMCIPKTYVCNGDLSNVTINLHGGIDFSFIKK